MRAQRAYRAPYTYLAESSEQPGLIKIGATQRPDYECKRLNERYIQPISIHACVRAYSVLPPVLWCMFSSDALGCNWFLPSYQLKSFMSILSGFRDDELLRADDFLNIVAFIFPTGAPECAHAYTRAEAYLRKSRRLREPARKIPIALANAGR